jgi:non-ribosomal peptide synthetase component E (peptide arylation enzyme)
LALLTDTGALSIRGRLKAVVNRGGEKVAAAEVERHLMAHPAVVDVAVAALPHPMLGERVGAWIQADDPAPSLAGLRQWLRDRGVASFKHPDHLVLVESLPRDSAGELERVTLRP